MCYSRTKKSKKIWQPETNRMTNFPLKFNSDETTQMQKKLHPFAKMSNHEQTIDKPNFQKNMGIMGLRSVSSFSDRLLNSFDIDQDHKISFQDFLQYMEVIKCGSSRNKALVSFRLIDIKNKNQVSPQDFRNFLADYYQSWISITNSSLNYQLKERTDAYVKNLFNKVRDETGKNVVTFDYYAEKLYKNKNFMEAFSFMTKGVATMITEGQDQKNNQSFILYQTLKNVRQVYDDNFKSSWQQQKPSQTINQQDYPSNEREQKEVQHKKASFLQQFLPRLIGKKIDEDTNKNRSALTGNNFLMQENNGTKLANFKNEEKIKWLEQRLKYVESSLKEIIKDTDPIYAKLSKSHQINQNSQEFDIRSIIMNIPKSHINKSGAEGKMILFGDQKWNLVLNMMSGIQTAVSSIQGYQQIFSDEPGDFNLKYTFQLVPRRFGDQKKSSRVCHFTDYAPNTFNHIRKIFSIDNKEYINSIGPSKLMQSLMMGELSSLTQLTSQGKSGSFFYYTTDGKYMLKTIQHRQYQFFRNILKDYYMYLKNNPDSMLIKFFGLHRLQFDRDFGEQETKGKIYFVIMGNIFKTRQKIDERYDIKGSSYGRSNKSQDPNATKKDLDFLQNRPEGINLGEQKRNKIISIVRRDAQFLQKCTIIDYSLLVGIFKKSNSIMLSTLFGKKQKARDQDLRETRVYFDSQNQQGYIIGVIDILIEYEALKKMQYHFKKLIHGEGVSAVPPQDYAARFVNFIQKKVFPPSSEFSKDPQTRKMVI